MQGNVMRPSERLTLKYSLWVALIFLIGFAPYALLGLIPEAGWTFVAIYLAANAVWIIVALLLIPPYCRSIRYELGEEEVVVRRGILTRSEDVVPYRMVTNVTLKRGPLDRWLGLGTLRIHTAGFSQQATAECVLAGLDNYEQVREALMAAVRRQRGAAMQAPETRPLGHDDVPELLHGILDEVRALRGDRKE
ncbi:MAG: PH domain-containing protein [Chloroflexi bacterium]|nr:PH domain-containing protein [Chloroflexota bacterium]